LESLIEFFERVTGLTPTDSQKVLLIKLEDFSIKKIITSSGRQTGKSLVSAVFCIWLMFVYAREIKEQIQVLLVSAQESEIYRHINDIFSKNKDYFDLKNSVVAVGLKDEVPVKGFIMRDTRSRVRIAEDVTSQVLGPSADLLILDECASMERKVINEAKGCLSGSIYRTLLISTPHRVGSYFNDIALNPSKDGYILSTWTKLQCPWHTKEEIEDNKRDLSPMEYNIYVLGIPPSKHMISLFPSSRVKGCIVDKVHTVCDNRVMGIDTGYKHTVVFISERVTKNHYKLLYYHVYKKVGTIKDIKGNLEDLVNEYHVKEIHIDSKPIEYKNDLGRKICGINVTSIDFKVHKEMMVGQLRKLIMSGHRHLEIPKSMVDLIKSLPHYKLRKQGKRKSKAEGTNIVDALLLSVYIAKFSNKPRPYMKCSFRKI